MKICSFAARNVSISRSSRQVSHPTRRPGNPYVFDIDETAEHAGGQGRRHWKRVAVRQLAIGLVHEQPGGRMALDEADESVELTSRDHAAGRVVRIRDADEPRICPQPCCDGLDVQTPAIFESKVDGLDVCTDGTGSLEVRRVVRRADECVRLRGEQRRRDDEERGRRTGGDENVIG